jgi:hypothetical protein
MKLWQAIAAVTLLSVQTSSAALLGSFAGSVNGWSSGGPVETSATVGLCLVASGFCPPQLSFVATTADAGTVRTFDAMTSAAFPVVESFLTNGNDDWVRISFDLSISGFFSSRKEAVAFAASSSTNGIDFAGFDVTSIEIALGDDFRVGGLVGQPGTEIYGSWSVSVYGTPIPEPATAVFVASGLVALGARRRSRPAPAGAQRVESLI